MIQIEQFFLLLFLFLVPSLKSQVTDQNVRKLAALDLYGNPGCDYAAIVHVDGQPFRLLIDTGSSNIAVASQDCESCGVNPRFQHTKSGRNKPISVGYGSGSWRGVLTTTHVQIGDIGPFPMQVAIIQEHTKFFIPSCPHFQGILGLAYAPLSRTPSSPVVDILVSNGVPDGFAIQLCDSMDKDPANKQGNLWIGGYDSTFIKSPMIYTPIEKEDYYEIRLLEFSVGNDVLSYPGRDLPHSDTILDSGTTQMLFHDRAYVNALTAAIKNNNLIQFQNSNVVPKEFWDGDVCVSKRASGYSFRKDLNLSITLSGPAKLSLHWDNFFREIKCDNDLCVCYSVGYDKNRVNILGEAIMMDYVVFFDRGAKRIGFAEGKDCEKKASVDGIDVLAHARQPSQKQEGILISIYRIFGL